MIVVLAICGCVSSEGEHITPGKSNVPTIGVHFTFSLPQRIVGKRNTQQTRMTPDVVQDDQDAASFRGFSDVHLFCYDDVPTENTNPIGDIVSVSTLASEAVEDATPEDYAVSNDIKIPVGTSHFGFYGRADDAPMTHEERMHYGCVEAVGVKNSDFKGNSAVRFRPVPICTSTENMGGSPKGQALLNLLNDLLNITGPEEAPENQWNTSENPTLKEAYRTLTELRTSSSFNVQTILATLWQALGQVPEKASGYQLAQRIVQKIGESCNDTLPPTDISEIVLMEQYQGFPEDLHLPAGSARIVWNEEQRRFEFPEVQAYGKELDIPALTDYCYPMNLQYHVMSEILASDSIVMSKDLVAEPAEQPGETGQSNTGQSEDPTGTNVSPDGNPQTEANDSLKYTSWREVLDSLYAGASDRVSSSTKSVAMVQQVEYAVGHLSLRARIQNGTLYDAFGKPVDVSAGFTLKGYIVGGQREVDYQFMPVEDAHDYAIYDTDLGEEKPLVRRGYWTAEDHILGFGTAPDRPIYLAMELVNNGPAFQGTDGEIVHGATFYLVASMVPSEGTNYAFGYLDRIFRKDYETQVNLTINNGWPDKNGDNIPDPDLDEKGNPKPLTGLATATYGMPTYHQPAFEFGLKVDLGWEDGITFENIEF